MADVGAKMTHEEVLEKLTDLFVQIGEDDDVVLADATTAEDVEGWDSIFHVKFIIAIEREFKIRFDASEINSAANAGELAAMVEKKIARA
jgi:acyl carrier protein